MHLKLLTYALKTPKYALKNSKISTPNIKTAYFVFILQIRTFSMNIKIRNKNLYFLERLLLVVLWGSP